MPDPKIVHTEEDFLKQKEKNNKILADFRKNKNKTKNKANKISQTQANKKKFGGS